MTNQEAARKLFNIKHDDRFSWTQESVDAFDLAISALREQDVSDINVGDMVSRRKAIDAMCWACGHDCDKSKFVYNAPQDEQVIVCPEHYALSTLPSAQPERKTGEMSRLIDGSTLIMWLNDWWASSFGQEETPESKAIHEVLDKVAEYIGKRTLSDESGYVESQSEEQILKCCIGLMQEMADCFREYLEFIDYEPEYEEEKQPFCFSYFHIVNRLFLWHTSHSGGTSTRAKCKELGIDDSGKQVEFYIWEDKDDES